MRWKSGKPNCSSACARMRLTAGWVTLMSREAALTLPVSITALKTSMWRKRMAKRAFLERRSQPYCIKKHLAQLCR